VSVCRGHLRCREGQLCLQACVDGADCAPGFSCASGRCDPETAQGTDAGADAATGAKLKSPDAGASPGEDAGAPGADSGKGGSTLNVSLAGSGCSCRTAEGASSAGASGAHGGAYLTATLMLWLARRSRRTIARRRTVGI